MLAETIHVISRISWLLLFLVTFITVRHAERAASLLCWNDKIPCQLQWRHTLNGSSFRIPAGALLMGLLSLMGDLVHWVSQYSKVRFIAS